MAELAAEFAAARGARWQTPPWLIWSGPLASDGDEHAAITALVRERWWEFNGEGRLDEMDEGPAVLLLTWVFGHMLEDDQEWISSDRAGELATKFVSLLPEHRRWFGNNWDGPPFPPSYPESDDAPTDWTRVSEALKAAFPLGPPEHFDTTRLREAGQGIWI